MKNPYLPMLTKIEDIVIENEARDIKTFKLSFIKKEDKENFTFLPGQFAELSILGVGESPIGIASSPTEKDYLLFTVKRAGVVTTRLHRSEIGETIGIRGPLGNTYPLPDMDGKNVLIIGGGFAFTTLRSTVKYILEKKNREKYKNLTVIYGARTPGELIYKNELWEWEKLKELKTYITVDKANGDWQRHVGVVPAILKQVAPTADNTIALVCGPPIMIKYTLLALNELGFKPEQFFLSLEMRMKCGIGKCGRCNIGHKYVCKDGPVFSFAELQKLPPEY
ncbi:heterodisulfide reductase subunit F [candidate division WOR-3 bacterium RBG_13_43_14]|uniref:Heterodisulfide reductase subunit F n=1 Tax=candidate division WOR-3 bacterium RBG_13_43_14 TaxID=1802590 RepID=A0A1F4U357_UNCW3|nr:MAG: heterodisulfide reductase subunit F [candidate division WOR-3 bacterium RBG_13_43_14]